MADQLTHLRAFFERLLFPELEASNVLARGTGFALARGAGLFVVYLPRGGKAALRLPPAGPRPFGASWFDPRTGKWKDAGRLSGDRPEVQAPGEEDWVLLVSR